MPDVPLPKPQKPIAGSIPTAQSAGSPTVTLPPSGLTPTASTAAAPTAAAPTPQNKSAAQGALAQNTNAPVTPPPSAFVATPPPTANTVTSAPPLGNAAPKPPAAPTFVPPTTAASPAAPTAAAMPPTGVKPGGNGASSSPVPTPTSQTPGSSAPVPAAPAVGSSQARPTAAQAGQAGQASQAAAPKPAVTPASVKQPFWKKITSSPKILIPVVAVVLLIIGGLAFAAIRMLGGQSTSVSVAPGTGQAGNTPATGGVGGSTGSTTGAGSSGQAVQLTYWGLWEPTTVLDEVFAEFEAANPGIQVTYVKQNHLDYRERLQTAIASGAGPDMFRYHASWVPMLREELAAMPASVMSPSEYQNTFFPVATQQLQSNGQIVGIPLMYDGLGLYINTAIFRQAAMAEPTTWAEVKTAASQLTVRSSNGEVERGGLAIGNASNVEHFADIIGLLMLQNGADPANPTTKQAQDALAFYTGFYKNDKVWSDKLPTSTVAFARGEVAMMFAPSWRVHEIQAMNPEFTDYKIIPTPSLGDKDIAWASYWAEGVNSKASTAKREAAWKLLKYLSSAEVMEKMYSAQSETRLFGQLYSRQDLAAQMAASTDSVTQKFVSAYLEDAPDAQSWYLNTYTHDSGINDQLIQYYQDAVNAIVAGSGTAESVMPTVAQGTTQVLRQYGVTTSR